MKTLLESMTNYQLLEYLQLAIKLNANTAYIDLIQEEIYMRMGVEVA